MTINNVFDELRELSIHLVLLGFLVEYVFKVEHIVLHEILRFMVILRDCKLDRTVPGCAHTTKVIILPRN
jgi:ABC-type iron transport system FetAB permease component